MKRENLIDLRDVLPGQRVDLVVERLKSLKPAESLSVVQERHPEVLCQTLMADFHDQVTCSAREQGVLEWRIDIVKKES